MSNEKTRSYNSASRLAKAALTRTRILAAARRLFRSSGFEAVTIESLAQAAKVSAPTVYALFQSKRGVLHAVLDEAVSAQDYDALVQQGRDSRSAEVTVLNGAKIARRMYDVERRELDMLRGASVLAPEFKILEKERERRRYERLEESVKMMAEQKAFKKGITIKKARDIFWALTGRDLYRMLVVEQGWSSDEYEKWLALHLKNSLLASRESGGQ